HEALARQPLDRQTLRRSGKANAVQASLTRLFDTAAIARSRCLLARLALAFLGFPNISLSFPGKIRVVLFGIVPSSLAEGRAKTRTPKRQVEGSRGAVWGASGVGISGAATPAI
ncbi:MAG TPA: hypothetical protein VK557_19370, partial [Pyrinomonadaceae bacterium]|nr:hypothetical protein [Pyrinomonadaceae bacterium]